MAVLYDLVVKPNFGVQHRYQEKVSTTVKCEWISLSGAVVIACPDVELVAGLADICKITVPPKD
jgi:hypothetical protein